MRALPAIALILIGAQTYAAPFATADQNPLLNGFLLNTDTPARLPASGITRATSTLNWSSTASIQRGDNENLVADIESREWRLTLEHAFSDTLTARMQIPYRTSNGGTLDNVIDHWHSLLGFPKGDRPDLPQDNLHLTYRRNGQSLIDVTDDRSGVGDITLAVGYQLAASPKNATSLWVHIKAPTGSSEDLSGSGAFDASLTLAQEHQLSQRWSTFASIAGTYLGTGDLLPNQQRHWLGSAALGFDYRYSQALTLTAQIDGHTAAFKDSRLDLLGNAWIFTVGGEYRWRAHWRAQFGIGEDVKVNASPDVTFVFGVGREWQ